MLTKKITAAVAALFMASTLATPVQPTAESAEATYPSTYTVSAETIADNFFPLINGEDINDYVAKNFDNTVDRIVYIENELLNSVNGDIRKINVADTLTAIGFLPESISHKFNNQYDNVYSVDIVGTDWYLEWNLSSQFGNSTSSTSSLVAFKKDEQVLMPGNYVQIYVGGNSIYFDNGAINKGVYVERPVEQMQNQPPKVVVAEGEFSATAYDFALFTSVYSAIQRAEQTKTIEQVQQTTYQEQAPQHIPSITEYYEAKLNGLDLAKASSAINARLDRGADIRCLKSIDILKDLMPDKEIEVETTGTTVSYSVNDGTRGVRLKFDQLDPCDHYLTTIEMNGRYSGCTYTASIKCGFELSTERHIEATLNCDGEKKINVQLAEPEDINDFWLYEANDKPINSETLSIIAALLQD